MTRKRRRIEDPEKQRARSAVLVALRSGRLVRPDHCSECGSRDVRIEAHHHNGYAAAHALDIVWLCRSCHRAADWEAFERGIRARTGARRTLEQRAAISAGLRGRRLSPEHLAKMRASRTGTTLSPETRAKLSVALSGRTLALDTRLKLSAARRKLTPEDVAALKERRAAGALMKELAADFGVCVDTVRRALTKGWLFNG